mmetsp:Transcript_19654/g.37499  ORF Transcript_19654/g.37499 Transcript_19654/m.37499 type:complete len:251 (-) Transcript_19654:239-991(-)
MKVSACNDSQIQVQRSTKCHLIIPDAVQRSRSAHFLKTNHTILYTCLAQHSTSLYGLKNAHLSSNSNYIMCLFLCRRFHDRQAHLAAGGHFHTLGPLGCGLGGSATKARVLTVHRHLAGQGGSGAGEGVQDYESKDGGEVEPAQWRDDPAEQVQVRVAHCGKRAHNLLWRVREPGEHEAADDDCVVDVQEVVDGGGDHHLHSAVSGDDGGEAALLQRVDGEGRSCRVCRGTLAHAPGPGEGTWAAARVGG